MTDRLFPIDDVPEVPIFREPRRSRGEGDARFRNDYPPEWDRCTSCFGVGFDQESLSNHERYELFHGFEYAAKLRREKPCSVCKGMGSVKARVRLEAGHRCVRCLHPYMPKGDAQMLGVEPSWREGGWSACDSECRHEVEGPTLRMREPGESEWNDATGLRVQTDDGPWERYAWTGRIVEEGFEVEAEWRILTVHHLSGDKADLRWGNLVALCQKCHLEIQAKVVLERVYPHEHSEWFKPHAAWWYALNYLDEDLPREEVTARLEELLSLERIV